jgi:hypothetical protein
VSAIRLFGFAVYFFMFFPYRCCVTKNAYKKVNLSFNRDLYRIPRYKVRVLTTVPEHLICHKMNCLVLLVYS